MRDEKLRGLVRAPKVCSLEWGLPGLPCDSSEDSCR